MRKTLKKHVFFHFSKNVRDFVILKKMKNRIRYSHEHTESKTV